ncbi:MAG: DUF2934 domain-containing protein [Phycisphaerae bacterium]|nr:DUF2934 domain-containing protein [Phycisphaerae bacterium]
MAKTTKHTTTKKTTTPATATVGQTIKAVSRARAEVANTITEEQIRRRAYEIYCARGCRPGDPDHDWHQAEAELRNTR